MDTSPAEKFTLAVIRENLHEVATGVPAKYIIDFALRYDHTCSLLMKKSAQNDSSLRETLLTMIVCAGSVSIRHLDLGGKTYEQELRSVEDAAFSKIFEGTREAIGGVRAEVFCREFHNAISMIITMVVRYRVEEMALAKNLEEAGFLK